MKGFVPFRRALPIFICKSLVIRILGEALMGIKNDCNRKKRTF